MNNLCSASTFFQKNNYNTYSWCGNEENPKQIDHIFIRKEDKKRIINCETGDPAGVMSDHHAIDTKLILAAYIPKKNQRRKRKKNGTHHQADDTEKKKKKKIEWHKILSNKDAFKSLLSENIITTSKPETNPNDDNDDGIDTNININTDNTNSNNNNSTDPYDRLSKCVKITAEELFSGEDSKRRKPWFELSQKTILEKIKERNDAFEIYTTEKSISNLTKLRNSRSNLKEKKKEAKTLWIASRVTELETMDVDPSTSWKAVKEIAAGLYGHHKNTATMKMKKPNGNFCKNDLENAEVFKNFYSKLYNNHDGTKYDETVLNEIDEQPEKPSLGIEPTDQEINRALSKMAYEKSPGPNGIPTEAFKNLGDGDGSILLREIIRKYWNDNEYNPEVFTRLGLCILPKTGDLSNPNKWRGIALGNIIAKVISSIIATRLTLHINTFGIDEQCGCLFGKGSTDATFTLKTSLQTIREHQLEAHVLFIDLVKTFDSVNQELLWKILKLYGIPNNLIIILKNSTLSSRTL